jgi:hypothetical protein
VRLCWGVFWGRLGAFFVGVWVWIGGLLLGVQVCGLGLVVFWCWLVVGELIYNDLVTF